MPLISEAYWASSEIAGERGWLTCKMCHFLHLIRSPSEVNALWWPFAWFTNIFTVCDHSPFLVQPHISSQISLSPISPSCSFQVADNPSKQLATAYEYIHFSGCLLLAKCTTKCTAFSSDHCYWFSFTTVLQDYFWEQYYSSPLLRHINIMCRLNVKPGFFLFLR